MTTSVAELTSALDLFAAAKVFRAAGLHAAARRIEYRARRTPLPVNRHAASNRVKNPSKVPA